MEQQILDIFYNKIVQEAQTGRVDCFFMMNMIFNLNVENTQITSTKSIEKDGLLVPTLKITNKELFDSLLVEYVEKAISFYDESEFSFLEDVKYITEGENIEKLQEEYLIKYVICTLFANLSYSDFMNPVKFLQDRIEMFNERILGDRRELYIGNLDSIKARLRIYEEKSPIKSESPHRLRGTLEYDDGYILELPEIYAGKTDDKYIIYGIQKTTEDAPVDETGYVKAIRKGLISKINGAPEHYILMIMAFLSLCHDKPIEAVPILIERYNAKRIALNHRTDMTEEEKDDYHNSLQFNITNVFMRYFTKIEDVTTGMNIDSAPFDLDDRLHLSITEPFSSRAVVFNELMEKVKNLSYRADDYSK